MDHDVDNFEEMTSFLPKINEEGWDEGEALEEK
jgi:hypothetical protein